MSSMTRFVVAGAFAALMGGLLLTADMMRASDGRPPAVGASAPARTQAESTDATTSEPQPTSEGEGGDAEITTGILPGVDLVTEEVRPGVFRVLSDGAHDLSKRVGSVLVDGDGSVWVLKYRAISVDRPWGVATENVRVIRLGDERVSLRPDAERRLLNLSIDASGSLVLMGLPRDRRMVFDGRAWSGPARAPRARGYEGCLGRDRSGDYVAPDGACYSSSQVGLVRFDEDGTSRILRQPETGLEIDGYPHGLLVTDDGTLWSTIRTSDDDRARFGGLLSFDGREWSSYPYDGPDEPLTGSDRVIDPFVDEAGVVWVVFTGKAGISLVGWDGERWLVHGPVGTIMADEYASTLPDGTILFFGGATFDGTTLRPWDPIPGAAALHPLSVGPDGSAWTILREPGKRTGGLYVITPDAAAATE